MRAYSVGGVAIVSVALVDATSPCWRYASAAAKMSASRRSTLEALSSSVREAEEWVRVVVLGGYTSVLEHCKYTFEVVCSRVCSHQLVRHRIASYTQQSMRWSEGFLRDVVLEAARRLGEEVPHKPSRGDYAVYARVLKRALETLDTRDLLHVAARGYVIPPAVIERGGEELHTYLATLLDATRAYYELLARGVPREDARMLIPCSVKTRILVTMNARELLEVFLPLRLCRRAQWEIRLVAWQLLDLLRSREPILWRWAGPRCLRIAQLSGTQCTLDELLDGRCKLTIHKCPEGIPREAIPTCVSQASRPT